MTGSNETEGAVKTIAKTPTSNAPKLPQIVIS